MLQPLVYIVPCLTNETRRVPMNPNIHNLITATVSQVTAEGSFITKTKLLKLLYLFDVEYYRVHRQTFTGLHWKYFHLGPWTGEYDPILSGLVDREELIRRTGSRAEHDTEFYSTPRIVPIKEALSDFHDENILRGILNAWGSKTTGEILDYVYFQTEPIAQGERNEALDFSLIPEQSPQFYKRSSSGATPKEINAFRKRMEEKKAARAMNKMKATTFTPPRYDEEYLQAIDVMEEDAGNVH